MNKFRLFCIYLCSFFFFLCCTGFLGCSAKLGVKKESMEEKGENKVNKPVLSSMNKEKSNDLTLYNGLVKQTENWVFSPYSIKDCFSILYDASSGDTRNQLDSVLGFTIMKSGDYTNYDTKINLEEGSGLQIVNKGFINNNKKDTLNLDVLSTSNLEFIDMDEEAVYHINQFVLENTGNKIKDLLSPSSLNKETPLVLVNALYFLKNWNFNDSSIIWSDGNRYKSFSEILGTISVKELNENMDLLRLPYNSKNSNQYSMYIFSKSYSAEENTVDEYLSTIDEKDFYKLLDFNDYKGLDEYEQVYFNVPNFEISYKESVLKSLEKLGLTDLSNFDELGEISISDVFHGAYVKTDKNGTEAAAATAISTNDMASMPTKPDKEVIVDDDFVFVIKDDTEDIILFMGRVMEPSELEQ